MKISVLDLVFNYLSAFSWNLVNAIAVTLTERILISSKDNFTIAYRIRIAIEESNKVLPIYQNEHIDTFIKVFDWLIFLDSEGYPQLQIIDAILSFFTSMQANYFVDEIEEYLRANNDERIYQFYRLNESTIYAYLVTFVSSKVLYFPN